VREPTAGGGGGGGGAGVRRTEGAAGEDVGRGGPVVGLRPIEDLGGTAARHDGTFQTFASLAGTRR
jgi:hypothetical protein